VKRLLVVLPLIAGIAACVVQPVPPPGPQYPPPPPPQTFVPPPAQYIPSPPPQYEPAAPPAQYFPPPPPPPQGSYYPPASDGAYYPQTNDVNYPPPEPVVSVYVDPPTQQPEPIGVPWAPPPMLVEDPGPMPFYGAVWTGGYWVWDGQWVWAHGRWLPPPMVGYGWTPPYYEHRGAVVVFVPGSGGHRARSSCHRLPDCRLRSWRHVRALWRAPRSKVPMGYSFRRRPGRGRA